MIPSSAHLLDRRRDPEPSSIRAYICSWCPLLVWTENDSDNWFDRQNNSSIWAETRLSLETDSVVSNQLSEHQDSSSSVGYNRIRHLLLCDVENGHGIIATWVGGSRILYSTQQHRGSTTCRNRSATDCLKDSKAVNLADEYIVCREKYEWLWPLTYTQAHIFLAFLVTRTYYLADAEQKIMIDRAPHRSSK